MPEGPSTKRGAALTLPLALLDVTLALLVAKVPLKADVVRVTVADPLELDIAETSSSPPRAMTLRASIATGAVEEAVAFSPVEPAPVAIAVTLRA